MVESIFLSGLHHGNNVLSKAIFEKHSIQKNTHIDVFDNILLTNASGLREIHLHFQ